MMKSAFGSAAFARQERNEIALSSYLAYVNMFQYVCVRVCVNVCVCINYDFKLKNPTINHIF